MERPREMAAVRMGASAVVKGTEGFGTHRVTF
jgi:hypothetical protein